MQVKRCKIEWNLARLKGGHMLHVCHEATQALYFATNALSRLLAGCQLGNQVVCQCFAQTLNSGEWCGEIVGNVGDEIAAYLLLSAQLGHVCLNRISHCV